MNDTTLAQLETMFLALGDKTRLRLLELMADGPVPVGFLADELNASQPKVSRHLAYLRNAGMVTTTRDGRWVYYGIKYPRDEPPRRILESLITSIAGMRVDEDAYLAKYDHSDEAPAQIYANAYIRHSDPGSSTNEGDYDDGGATDERELDVFLL